MIELLSAYYTTFRLEFKKDFQRLQKHTPDYNIKQICGNEGSGAFPKRTAAHFYGHSMSNTDSNIITEIIEEVDRSYIYYFDKKDNDNKLQNLMAMLGHEKTVQYVRNKKMLLVPRNDLEKRAKMRIRVQR